MARPVVVVADPINQAGIDRLREHCEVRLLDGKHTELSDISALRDAQGVVVRALNVTADLLDACPQLAVVAKHGAGVDNIDVAAATERGVIVTNTGGTNAPAVAEAAVTLMLAALRRVPEVHRYVLEGQFNRRWELLFGDLWERTVGLVGCGNIGRTVARICRDGFGCTVLAYDPHVGAEDMASLGITKVDDLHDLLRRSNIVSVHTPLTPETRHLIDAAALRAMQPDAILVNTARGGVVDGRALAEALQNGTIGGAGIDAFEDEPPLPDDPLLRAPNAVFSPHCAGATHASRRRSALEAADAVLSVLAGERPKHCLNPAAWERRRGRTDA